MVHPLSHRDSDQTKLLGYPKFSILPDGWASLTYPLAAHERHLVTEVRRVNHKASPRSLKVNSDDQPRLDTLW